MPSLAPRPWHARTLVRVHGRCAPCFGCACPRPVCPREVRILAPSARSIPGSGFSSARHVPAWLHSHGVILPAASPAPALHLQPRSVRSSAQCARGRPPPNLAPSPPMGSPHLNSFRPHRSTSALPSPACLRALLASIRHRVPLRLRMRSFGYQSTRGRPHLCSALFGAQSGMTSPWRLPVRHGRTSPPPAPVRRDLATAPFSSARPRLASAYASPM